MPALTPEQRDAFWLDGYLMVENVIEGPRLAALRDDFNAWVEESRRNAKPYGEIIDGRPRFDLEAGHSAEKPALRRVNSPVEVSQAYYDCMADSAMTDMVADLIGPNVKFHHCKINSKLPGAKTEVKWHQDFPFTPHSNDDIVTALLFIDDVTADNGPLEVVGGTHRGPIHSLWHDRKFSAAVGEDIAGGRGRNALRCMGPGGS
jgi:ectoine hydroxylase-related dioxygenase (phytanoyl-CoA dioxygenase family)